MRLTLTLFNKTRVNGQQLLGGAAKQFSEGAKVMMRISREQLFFGGAKGIARISHKQLLKGARKRWGSARHTQSLTA